MSDEKRETPVLRLVPETKQEEPTPLGQLPTYDPNYVDLREVSDRVMACENMTEKFTHMYVSFDDLTDCNITEKGFNLYCEDEKYVYIYTVVKK